MNTCSTSASLRQACKASSIMAPLAAAVGSSGLIMMRRSMMRMSHNRRILASTTSEQKRYMMAKTRPPPGTMEDPPKQLKDVTFTLDDQGIATITLERPHRLNALSIEMGETILRLVDYLSAAPADKVRVCLIYGGPRAFSTGRDLKDSKLHTTLEQREHYMQLALDSVLAINRLPMPTIAAISGPTFGWGLELALACDLRLASKDATLCLPEASLGIFPGAGGCVFLRELVSPAIAKDLIYTSRRFSGSEAKELGVVNNAVMGVWHEAQALAKRVASNGPLGIRGAKEVIDGVHNVDLPTALRLSSQLRAPLTETDDFREALQAFEEKRKPVFHGR